MIPVVLGVDIGTSSTKGVLVDSSGAVVRSTQRAHAPSRPAPGHFEMDAESWWSEFVDIAAELTAPGDIDVVSVGVSGMGPCVLLTDAAGRPLRPAILYGVDTRAWKQIEELDAELGAETIHVRTGSRLTSQAVGPKLLWIARHEPEVWRSARMLFMPASWLGFRLTGRYALDHQSASQSLPLYDTESMGWYRPWWERIAPQIDPPPVLWPGDIVGEVQRETGGIRPGTPVIVGTIDAWSEAVSVDAQKPGDLMIMYGTSMFMIATTDRLLRDASLWSTVGAVPGTRNVAGGISASGAITQWWRAIAGEPDYATLLAEADASGAGARGLVLLPYFAGERTDPAARGMLAGLRLDHGRGDIYRAILEATAFAVGRDIRAMVAAGAVIDRVVAVGGGTRGRTWVQIVSDITGLPQQLPRVTIGASYGAAWLAARHIGAPDMRVWNPAAETIEPDPGAASRYAAVGQLFTGLLAATSPFNRPLADLAPQTEDHR